MASSDDAVNNRAEIDTSLPFRSVKAAVSMFGEKSEAKKFKKHSRHEEEEELKCLREELASIKLRLSDAENDKALALAELRSTKKLIEERPEIISHENRINAAETRTEVIRVAQEQPVEAMLEFNSLNREPQELQKELLEPEKKKDVAGKVGVSLMPVKQTSMEAMQGVQQSSHWPYQDVRTIEELEVKLTAATKDLAMLQKELATGDEARQQISLAASEALRNLSGDKSAIQKSQVAVSNPIHSVPLHVHDDDSKGKDDLKKALEIRTCLESSMKALLIELEAMSKELHELKDREANASAAVVTLTKELSKAKTELIATIRTESKATEAILGLSSALQQVTAEAEQAKEEAKALMEGANKAKADAEQAKAIINDADHQLQRAAKSVEAEATALQKFRAMYDRTISGEADCGSQIAWNEYLLTSPQSLNLNTEKFLQFGNNQSSTPKKKKHLIASLSSFLGKKGNV